MAISGSPVSIGRFIDAIRRLPADKPIVDRRKTYSTQKEHWLGWLGEYHGPGAYGRKVGMKRDAQYAYNHIVEPKMLLWLIAAAGVKPALVKAARLASGGVSTMPGKSASIRKHVPWSVVVTALWAVGSSPSNRPLHQSAARSMGGRRGCPSAYVTPSKRSPTRLQCSQPRV